MIAQPVGTRVIVVFGTKGGVGKTVVATNVAVGLAQLAKRPVCLIDLDLMALGDVGRMLKVSPQHSISEILPHMKKSGGLQALPIDQLVTPHADGVHLLPCVNSPRALGKISPQDLAMFLGLLRDSGKYPYIIIDAGKGFTDQLISAFDAANLILLVVTPDIISLYQTKWALGIIEDLQFPASMVKIVLNRAESRGGVGSENVRTALPVEVVGEIPSDGRTVGTSINEGNPLVTAYASTRVAEALKKLAETLTARQDLYMQHQEIPRHAQDRRSPQTAESTSTWLSRVATDDPIEVAQREDEIVVLKRRIHERLVEELDLKKLDLAALSNQARMQELRQKTERVITNLLTKEVGGLVASHEVRSRLVKEIADEALGLGPLEELLDDRDVTDILVNNKDQIYVERHGKLELTTKKFVSDDQVRTVIERIVAPMGRRVDEANPMVDARLPDGSRVNAIIPPLSLRGSVLSIRKFGRERLTLDELIRLQALTEPMAAFLRACVASRKNIIVSGGTGSGKTTMLNVLSAFIPDDERIITLEDAAELRLAQTHWISLEARPANIEGRGEVGVRELFRNALRMRPDRIIIGECRGEETLDMLQAMNTGHDGSLTTVHANSPKDVISRLDAMVLMSNIELPVRAIREMVASAIDVIVHTARQADGSRKITTVSEVMGLSPGGDVVLQDLFTFRQTGTEHDGGVVGDFVTTGMLPTFLNDLKVKGMGIDEALFTAGAAGIRPLPRAAARADEHADNGAAG